MLGTPREHYSRQTANGMSLVAQAVGRLCRFMRWVSHGRPPSSKDYSCTAFHPGGQKGFCYQVRAGAVRPGDVRWGGQSRGETVAFEDHQRASSLSEVSPLCCFIPREDGKPELILKKRRRKRGGGIREEGWSRI